MPKVITFANGNTITWLYDAAGVKLQKQTFEAGLSTTNTHDYIGGIEYQDNVLEAIYTDEGRAKPYGTAYRYEYTIKDHLGNARVMFCDVDNDGIVAESEIIQEDHYYPFGMRHEGYGRTITAQGENFYQFNGTEKVEDFDLAWHHTLFRSYDPTVGRWHQIDPKNSARESSYVGLGNNPIIYSDMLGDTIIDKNGIAESYRNSINNQISAIDQLLSNESIDFSTFGTTKETVNQLKSELNGVIDELDQMDASKQHYKVQYNDEFTSGEGGVSFDNSDNSVLIEVGKGTGNGVIAQEMLHGYQFENGEISISYDNSKYGTLYDITDETATYKREHIIVQGVAGLQSRNNITDDSVLQNGAKQTPPLYQNLPRTSKTLNSPEGVYLRLRNDSRKNNGPAIASPREVFIGWND